MISTDLSTIAAIFSALAFLISCVALYIARAASEYAGAAFQYTKHRSEKSQVAAISAQLTELDDAYHALLDSHKKLRSRIGMRELREKRRNDDDNAPPPGDAPDPQSDPEGWKRHMRAKLRLGHPK